MSPEKQIAIVAATILLLTTLAILIRALPKRLKHDRFINKWRLLQNLCRDKATWNEAVLLGDKLLDEALKKRKFKGKTMGERLVSAGAKFINNDAVWYSHNLVKKLNINPNAKLNENEVKQALIGFRQALRDVGALPSPKEEKSDKEGLA